MSRLSAKSPAPPASAPAPRRRLIVALLLTACALAFLGFRIAATLTHAKPARLRLGEEVALTPPPPLPADDLSSLRDKLLQLEQHRAQAAARPQEAGAHLELAREALRTGDALTAYQAFRQAFRIAPHDDAALLDAYGRAQMQLGLYADAERTYHQLVSRAPTSVFGYVGMNRVCLAREQRQEAARALEAGLKFLPAADVPGRLRLAFEIEQNGNLPRALEIAQAIRAQSPRSPEARLAEARLLFKLQRLAEARPLLETLAREQPGSVAARNYLAGTLDNPLARQRDPERAESLLLETIEREPRDPTAYVRLGEMYQAQEKPRQAAYIYTGLLALQPKSSSARLQLARAYRRIGEEKTAAEQERIAHRLLAQEREAERLVTRRDQRPTDPQRRLALARHYVSVGEYARALAEVQAAYVLAKAAPDVRREFAAFYRRLGVKPPLPLRGLP